MFNPLLFQENAVDDLIEKFKSLRRKSLRNQTSKNGEMEIPPLLLKSPTGSGKTLMVSHFVRKLNHQADWDEDKAFIWITCSDDLAMQSKDKFIKYFENEVENNPLTAADIANDGLKKNEIIFLNWQKIATRNPKSRNLRRPEDEEDSEKETGSYFDDFVETTHKNNRNIIFIIDEAHAHANTHLAKELTKLISPMAILYVTATPKSEIELKARQNDSFVEVMREDVVNEGLIKEGIHVQTKEDLIGYENKDLDEVLIDLSIKKRNEIAKEFKKLKKEIVPLVLIQLPNDDSKLIDVGEQSKEEIVINLLRNKGINVNKIAKWFKDKSRPEFIEENDDKHEFLLFKQAAGTGWDCPRAHVLVMFREIKSEAFHIQTVGRILRMPEPFNAADYKNSTLSKTGFLITNHERNIINAKWDDISPNKPHIYTAQRKKEISNIKLMSSYISRIEYGDLSNSFKFQGSFINSMNKYFNIPNNAALGAAAKKLSDAGINLKPTLINRLIVDAKFEDFDQLYYEFNEKGHDLDFEISRHDVEKTFNYFCYKILKEQTEEESKVSSIKRSWGLLKSAIRVWFEETLNIEENNYYRIFINDINQGANSKFRPAITQSLKEYKPILQKIIEDRRKQEEQKESPVFTIQDEYYYTDDYEEVKMSLCALNRTYIRKNDYSGKKNETRFMNYIDRKTEKIEWWFKNGDYGREYYAINYHNSEKNMLSLFYPDWIIKFKDGRIGIFDTKAGDTATNRMAKDKAEHLHNKLKLLGKGYIGGIAVFRNGIWHYNNSKTYNYSHDKLNKDWKKFEELFQ